jgi:hypothetical protein
VVVAEEADAWSSSCQKHVKARCFTDVTSNPTMPLETDTSWSIMCKDYVYSTRGRQPFNLVGRIVSLGVTLERVRAPFVIRRTIATTDPTNPNGVPSLILDIQRAPIPQIDQAG